MRTAWAFIRRDALIAASYRTAAVVQLLRILVAVPFFFYLSSLLGEKGAEHLARYGGSYFAFLLIGVGFLDYVGISLRSFTNSLRESQLTGTLEIIMLSPTRLWQLLLYSSLWVYLLATVRFGLYLLVGMLFKLDLDQANVPAALVVLFLAVVALASFGIVSASVTLVIKRGEFLNTAMAMLSSFAGGVLFPVALLPGWLQVVAQFIPTTHALEGLRLALFQGYGVVELLPQILVLLAMIAVLLPIALGSFSLAMRWSRATGSLAQY